MSLEADYLGAFEEHSPEALLLDVTPISYAQCGLYRQFHRVEQDVYTNLRYLFQKRNGTPLSVRNVPNKYLG